MPASDSFGPLNRPISPENCVVMSVDEYETIRLIDLQGFTQEQCAEQMNIARTTVQRIYNDARQKLADSLVNSKVLRIEGETSNCVKGWRNSADAEAATVIGSAGKKGKENSSINQFSLSRTINPEKPAGCKL